MLARISSCLFMALATINTLCVAGESINWNGNNWAMSCDFKGGDLRSVVVKGEDCGGECERESQCTHFAWSAWNGGTCWLKTGPVSKDDAFVADDPTVVCGVAARPSSGKCNPACAPGLCCSQYGYCGSTPEYCGGSSENTDNGLINENQFNCVFDQLDAQTRARRWQDLQEALRQVPFKPQNQNEVMIFLAHVSHETDGLKTYEEICATAGICANNYNHADWCGAIQGVPGKQYYGRGWLQLSYPCNYNAAGKALGLDLWRNPELVASADKVACAAGLWFWNEQKMGAPAREGNFAATTRILNSVECGPTPQQGGRIERYQKVRQCFGLSPQSNDIQC